MKFFKSHLRYDFNVSPRLRQRILGFKSFVFMLSVHYLEVNIPLFVLHFQFFRHKLLQLLDFIRSVVKVKLLDINLWGVKVPDVYFIQIVQFALLRLCVCFQRERRILWLFSKRLLNCHLRSTLLEFVLELRGRNVFVDALAESWRPVQI